MDYKTEQDYIWDALDDAFPKAEHSVVYKTNLNEQMETLERDCIENALQGTEQELKERLKVFQQMLRIFCFKST